MGESLSVLHKISSESKQSGRHDGELFKSLKLLKAKQDNNFYFITDIGFSQFFIFVWTENSIELHNILSTQHILHFDATSAVCSDGPNGQKILYYYQSIKKSFAR